MAYPTGQLVVDLRAIADNWKIVQSHLKPNTLCGAVVKANAYGLGVERIAPRIYDQGCRHFYVSNLKEAIQLRSLIGLDAKVYVLMGCIEGSESTFVAKSLAPVIVSMDMFWRWAKFLERIGKSSESVLKINTGMTRLGIQEEEFLKLLDTPKNLETASVSSLMSHLACADEPSHELNAQQIDRFDNLLMKSKNAGFDFGATLANSAGVFLGIKAHYDLVRPGIALYGGNAGLSPNPFKPVVKLNLPIIQVRDVKAGESIGYGATCSFETDRRVAVVSGGYADGIFRSLSNTGWGFLGDRRVPIVGRVSMDSTLFDVTKVDLKELSRPGVSIEILGNNILIDDLAQAAGTIGYEIITSIGARYERCYIE